MLKHLIIFIFIVIFKTTGLSAQINYYAIADSLYKAKDFKSGATAYITAAKKSIEPATIKAAYYNAACCFALNHDTANAIAYLKKAVFKYGYRSTGIMSDADLISLHHTKTWKKVVAKISSGQKLLRDPTHPKLITTDIHHFWQAYDAAQKDTTHMKEIFQARYFDKATPGLKDYIATKVGTIESFVASQKAKPKFYAAIRKNTLSIDNMKEEIMQGFQKFKNLYADAIFPDIYFVIGRGTSAGTVSENGLLIGVDQIAKSEDIPTDELDLWSRLTFREVKGMPVIVAHELVHSQQDKLKRDTTLLSYAVREGMADFFAELVTGVNPGQRQCDFAKGKEKKIWQDFEKEIYLDRYSNWIGNARQERPYHPSDLGYYIGYEICKSYYNEMPDKKQAIIDIFNIRDYTAFLAKSKYAEKMAVLSE
ncbi:MAG TPA: DUF2268 domain-containing putative Zn-dependent protease [Segetibacter sp.]